ncbi:MAG: hypothetical protein GY909_09565 [Oligoflexia bacterium]|nr:hypothetical protein [Oligoflexia bacterium]
MLKISRRKEKALTLMSMVIMVAFFVVVTMLAGCSQKEEIRSFATTETVAQQLGKDNDLIIVDGKYRFDDIQISQPVKNIPIPVLGTFVREFANVFANFFVILNSDWEVDQEAAYIDIPELDPEYIKSLEIRRIQLSIVPGSENETRNPFYRFYQRVTGKRPKLDFIKKIHISIATEDMEKTEQKIRIASYDFDRKELKRCKKQCLEFFITRDAAGTSPINLIPIIQNTKRIYIYPEVEVHSAPRRKFDIKGKIDFRVKFKLPF